MNLATIRAELGAWVTAVTGLKTYWRSRPNDWQAQAWAELRIVSPRMVGRDAFDSRENGNDLYPRQRGLRSFILEVQVWSHSHADTKDSLYYIEQLRNTLVRYAFAACAFGAVQNTVVLDRVVMDRDMSVTQLDLLFYADAESEDSTATTWIETVDMDGTIQPTGDHITGEFP